MSWSPELLPSGPGAPPALTRRAKGALITHRGHCRQCLDALLDRAPDQMCEQGAALLAQARVERRP